MTINGTSGKLLKFILEYKREHDGNSPTIREMCDAMDGVSTSHVHGMLKRLEEFGYIRFSDRGVSRRVEVVGDRSQLRT
jgi:SOS-response transcriptional repressor LexA